MNKERENETLTLAELINRTFMKSDNGKEAYIMASKQSTIFSFWTNIAGKKLANLSKPYKIKDGKIYIATKSPTVSQQFYFIKDKILEKVNLYSKPLGIEITELITGYKNYDEITKDNDIPKGEKMVFVNSKEFENIELDDNLIKSIKNSINKIKPLNEKQKNELTNKILNNYKAKKYRKNI